MELPAILVSDLHLTSRPEEAYRWELFTWLAEEARHEEVKTLVIAGDLTDAKDYHSAELVNRVVRKLLEVMQFGGIKNIYILMGNHDYLKAGHAFFSFLSHIPGITFITRITEVTADDGPNALFLPHTKTPLQDWKDLDVSHFTYVFMHQTAPGSIASNGMKMEGDALPSFKDVVVYSGDIHVPQIIGDIEYIGSPYPVHFGDTFKARAILLDRRNRPVDLYFKTIRRDSLTVRGAADFNKQIEQLRKGDHLKLKVLLGEEEKHDWQTIKLAMQHKCRELGIELHGIELNVDRVQRRAMSSAVHTPVRESDNAADAVLAYVLAEELGPTALEIGLELIDAPRSR